ncbi:hypothetical protein ES703_65801 [subsurface metagenome]
MKMQEEYDFSNAEKGKFYHPLNELEIPIYLDSDVKEFYTQLSIKREADLSKIVNSILKKEIEIYKEIES